MNACRSRRLHVAHVPWIVSEVALLRHTSAFFGVRSKEDPLFTLSATHVTWSLKKLGWVGRDKGGVLDRLSEEDGIESRGRENSMMVFVCCCLFRSLDLGLDLGLDLRLDLGCGLGCWLVADG